MSIQYIRSIYIIMVSFFIVFFQRLWALLFWSFVWQDLWGSGWPLGDASTWPFFRSFNISVWLSVEFKVLSAPRRMLSLFICCHHRRPLVPDTSVPATHHMHARASAQPAPCATRHDLLCTTTVSTCCLWWTEYNNSSDAWRRTTVSRINTRSELSETKGEKKSASLLEKDWYSIFDIYTSIFKKKRASCDAAYGMHTWRHIHFPRLYDTTVVFK